MSTQEEKDILAVLETSPKEVTGLLKAIEEGNIDGRMYVGSCACLVGTLAYLKGVEFDCWGLVDYAGIEEAVRPINGDSPAELFFAKIAPGHTPENNKHSKEAYDLIKGWAGEKGLLK